MVIVGAPFISVVAPNLNEERYLPTFLSSLAKQTYRNFEVILVDGASQDFSIFIAWLYRRSLNLKIVINSVRNIGFIRNLGAWFANGDIIIQTSSDTYFEPQLLEKVAEYYEHHPDVVSVAGRTFPLGTSIFTHVAYQLFDFIRYIFTVSPLPVHKYRPGGNFLSMRAETFRAIGGFPEAKINEDGLLGQKLDAHIKRTKQKVVFHLNLWIGHHAKRFEAVGGIRTLLFYAYVFKNMFPFLNWLLSPIERQSGEIFATRSDLGG